LGSWVEILTQTYKFLTKFNKCQHLTRVAKFAWNHFIELKIAKFGGKNYSKK